MSSGTPLLQGGEILVWHAIAVLGENASLRNIADHCGLPIDQVERCLLTMEQLGLTEPRCHDWRKPN
jgi:DNA-binding IclR family transcriptional regulator